MSFVFSLKVFSRPKCSSFEEKGGEVHIAYPSGDLYSALSLANNVYITAVCNNSTRIIDHVANPAQQKCLVKRGFQNATFPLSMQRVVCPYDARKEDWYVAAVQTGRPIFLPSSVFEEQMAAMGVGAYPIFVNSSLIAIVMIKFSFWSVDHSLTRNPVTLDDPVHTSIFETL